MVFFLLFMGSRIDEQIDQFYLNNMLATGATTIFE